MNKINKNRKIFALTLLLMFINTIFLNNLDINNDCVNNDVDNPISKDILQVSEYPSTHSKIFNSDINVTLHQSYLNTTTIEFDNLSHENSFSVPCPKESTFNSSFTNFTIENIYAPNKTVIVEDDYIGSSSFHYLDRNYISFETGGIGYIENISLRLRERLDTDTTYILLRLYNSENDSGNIRPKNLIATITSGATPKGEINSSGNQYYWWNYINAHQFFNSSNTFNNTFFFYADIDSASSDPLAEIRWDGCYDALANDNDDESLVLDVTEQIFEKGGVGGDPIDLTLKVSFSPYNEIAKPEYVDLKINEKSVKNIANGSGYYESYNDEYSDIDGKIDFQITTGWWDVSCNITKVQVNYTKTDIKANSKFVVNSNDANVIWNVTLDQDVNWFDKRITNHSTINFTIPSSWNNIEVYNDTTQKSINIINHNGYKTVTTYNAGNGTNWFLNATSDNLIQDIHVYSNSIEKYIVNITNILDISTNFSKNVDGNVLNLTIYTPNPFNKINHTEQLTSFSGSEVNFTSWTILNNATEYGEYIVQIFWYNNSDAGYFEKNITIMANTDLILTSPSNNGYYNKNDDPFNITVFYNDTVRSEGIYSTTIEYTNNSQTGYLDPFDAVGNYNLTIDPSDFDYGSNQIIINASKQYYNFKTLTFTFNIVNVTEIVIPKTSFTTINKINVTCTFYYNDTISNTPITSATIDNEEIPSTFTSYIVNHGNGSYTVKLNSSTVDARTEPYRYNLSISQTGKQPQELNLEITLIPTNTSIEIVSYMSSFKRNALLNQTIEFYFNNTYNNKFVANLNTNDVKVYNSSGYLWNTNDFNWNLAKHSTENLYILNISTNTLNSGIHILSFNVSNFPNYNWSTYQLNFTLIGNTSSIVDFTLKKGVNTIDIDDGVYNCYLDNDLTFEFKIADNDQNNATVKDALGQAIYNISYNRNVGSQLFGYLSSANLIYNDILEIFSGIVDISSITEEGNYTITISIVLPNYEIQSYVFYLVISEEPTIPYTPSLIEQLFPYIILIAIVSSISITSLYLVNKKVIKPKKLEKQKILKEVKSIFEDVVNIEHILVIYNSLEIYFKSIGIEEIPTDLISGLLSAVSSFAKEIKSEESLDEINYGDKKILISKGEYITVALILSEHASLGLRNLLDKYILAFENKYKSILENWKGNKTDIKNADDLTDEIFNITVLHPHKIEHDISKIKSLKKPNSKDILKIAMNIEKEKDKEYLFVGALLNEAMLLLDKNTAEIFIGIKELRDNNILVPFPITELEKMISKPKEKIEKKEEIQISNEPTIKDIKNIEKTVKKYEKEQEFEKAINSCEDALSIATKLNLHEEINRLEDKIRLITIEKGTLNMNNMIKDADMLKAEGDYQTASELYIKASHIGSEMFKLGRTDLHKKVKQLITLSNECLKKIEDN